MNPPQVQQPFTPGSESVASAQNAAPQMLPDPAYVAEVSKLRRHELQSLSNRLGDVTRREWARAWNAACALGLGGAIGGTFGLLGLQNPTHTQKVHYWIAIGTALVLTVVCGLASLNVSTERADSVGNIKRDLDKMLEAYPLESILQSRPETTQE